MTLSFWSYFLLPELKGKTLEEVRCLMLSHVRTIVNGTARYARRCWDFRSTTSSAITPAQRTQRGGRGLRSKSDWTSCPSKRSNIRSKCPMPRPTASSPAKRLLDQFNFSFGAHPPACVGTKWLDTVFVLMLVPRASFLSMLLINLQACMERCHIPIIAPKLSSAHSLAS